MSSDQQLATGALASLCPVNLSTASGGRLLDRAGGVEAGLRACSTGSRVSSARARGAARGCRPGPVDTGALAAVAVAYVRFAFDPPALFRIMFSEPCDRDSERPRVGDRGRHQLDRAMSSEPSRGDTDALATAVWALVHGVAFLHLDGKRDTSWSQVVADRATAAVRASLGLIGE